MPYSLMQPISISRPLISFKWKFNLRIFWILGSLSILGLLVFYIYQVNSYTREVFLIDAYRTNVKELSEKNEILEINLAQLSSLKNIEDFLTLHSFQKVSKTKYIRILESSVAAKSR